MSGKASDDVTIERPVSIVGRDNELEQLRSALRDVQHGVSRFVLIGGEAGIGKTTLVERIRHESALEGFVSMVGYCRDTWTTTPYAPWDDLLSRLRISSDTNLRAIVGAWDEIETRFEDVRTGRAALFAEIIEYTRDLSANQPLLILIEDLHWADQASLDLLDHFALRLDHLNVLLIATYREDEVTRHHPLFRFLPALVRDSHATRLHLRPLDRQEIETLISRRYGLSQTDHDRLLTYVFTRSEGNPLFAGELLQSLAADGTLKRSASGSGGYWTVGKLTGSQVPPLVQQVIEARLSHLSTKARDIANVAAVIGEDVPIDILTRVADVGSDALPSGIDEAFEARVLVESSQPMKLRFTHGLVREALLNGLSPTRRRSSHRRIAEALIEGARSEPDIVAHHLQQAGDDRAFLWLLRAGQRAERSYAFNMAAERYRNALALLGDNDEDIRRRGWLLFQIGCLVNLSDRERALTCFEEAAHIGNIAGDRMLAVCARCRYHLILTQIGDVRRSLTQLQESADAFDRLTPDDLPNDRELVESGIIPAEIPEINPFRGELIKEMAVAGRVAEAIEIGERFVEYAEAQSSDLVAARGIGEAWYGLGTAYTVLGQPEKARRAAARSREWFQRLGDYAWVNNALSLDLWIVLWYETDHLAERNRLVSDANAAWRKATGALSDESAEADTDLWTQLLDGRWDNVARQAPAGLAGHALIAWRLDAVNALSTLATWRGEYHQAANYIASVLPEGPVATVGSLPLVHTSRMLRVACGIALARVDLPAARAWLVAHDRWLNASGSVLGRVEGSLLWSDYYDLSGDRDAALRRTNQALEQATQPRQPHALMLSHRVMGKRLRDVHELDEAERHLQAALSLAEACGAPFQRAIVQLELAELRKMTGDLEASLSLLDEARAVCESLGAQPALARINALSLQLTTADPAAKHVEIPSGLSDREVDVLRLIVHGLSNAEVGARLFISPRTVSTHLTSIYGKIGVKSRHAASRFAQDHGIV